MAVICSVEFPDTPAGKASLGLAVIELLDARRQFVVTPAFDVGPDGPQVTTGFILSYPAAPVLIADDEPVPA